MQEYIRSIGACLIQMGDANEGPVVDVMHTLTDESSRLLGCIKLLNHKVHQAMLQGQLDTQLAETQSMQTYYDMSTVRSCASNSDLQQS